MSRLLWRSLVTVAIASAFVAGSVLAGVVAPRAQADAHTTHGSAARAEFHDAMRQLWEDHITWTRLVIVSFASQSDPLPDFDATFARLLRNQDEIGDAIKPFYGDAAGEELSGLLREHITGAAALLTAAKSGEQEDVVAASEAWYRNADEIAAFLSSANPSNWGEEEMRGMMREHLDLTLAEAVARLQGRYEAEIDIYDEIHDQILHMADMLSDGIIAQFPAAFGR